MLDVRGVYIVIFSLAAVACFLSVWRASQVADRDTRVGLVGLLLSSGAWAAAIVGRMVATTTTGKVTFYIVGLVVGLATVGAWLYFCSAYAGYDYHRRRRLRLVGLGVYLAIAALKLTNPFHSLYFTYTVSGGSFPHLLISFSAIHWVVSGLAYALSAVGFYLLYELFRESQFETTKLGVLVGLTALPVVVDMVAFSGVAPRLVLPFNYEPVGVALFAVGVLYVVDETFVAVPRRWRTELVEQIDTPIVLLGQDGRVRDFNRRAQELFPTAADVLGRPLADVDPQLQSGVENPDEVLELRREGTTQFYTVQRLPLTRGSGLAGEIVVYRDVTEIERKRRELQRQNDQLNEFSVALNHELRNAITVLQGVIDQPSEPMPATRDFDGAEMQRADSAVTRMQRVIGDLSTLARYGQTPETTSDCELRATVANAWDDRAFGDLEYTVTTDATVTANHPRLEELFREAFQFAHANEATTVTVDVNDDVLCITDDGDPLPPALLDDALEFGPPSPRGNSEMSLPNVRLLARVQGWTTEIDPSYDDGVRIRISGVAIRAE